MTGQTYGSKIIEIFIENALISQMMDMLGGRVAIFAETFANFQSLLTFCFPFRGLQIGAIFLAPCSSRPEPFS